MTHSIPRFCVVGAGRAGLIHARNLAQRIRSALAAGRPLPTDFWEIWALTVLSLALAAALHSGSAWAVDPFVLKDIRVEGLQRTDAGTVFASLPFLGTLLAPNITPDPDTGIGAWSDAEIDAAEIDRLIAARNAARKARDFKRADALRNELKSKGWIIEDTPKGPRLKAV